MRRCGRGCDRSARGSRIARCRRGTSIETVGIQKFKNDRSLERRSDRDDPPLGRCRRAAGRSERHAAPEVVDRRPGLELRGGVRPEGTGHDDQVVRLHHARDIAGRVGQARHALRHHRTALGAGRSRSGRRRSRAARSPITRSPTSNRPSQGRPPPPSRCRCRSWNGPSASRAK